MLAPRYADDGEPLLPLTRAQLEAKRAVDRKVAEGTYAFERVPCAVCGGADLEPLAGKDRNGLRAPVGCCRGCGLVQTNPRMTAEAYRAFYNAEYAVLHDGDLSPADVFARERERGRRIADFVAARVALAGRFVVEVGCGSGGILAAFRERGCEVLGVDLGEGRLAYGRAQDDLDLRVGQLAELDLGRAPDLVIYSHVLEHVLDPADELARLTATLAPGGLVYVEVPGIKRLDLGYEDDLLRYLQNAHVHHFSATTLDNLMRKHGFDRIWADEQVRSLYRPRMPTDRASCDDGPAVMRSLQAAEHRRQRFRPKAALRSALVRTGLFALAKRTWRTLRR